MGVCGSKPSKVGDANHTQPTDNKSSIHSADWRHLKEGEKDTNIAAALRAKRRGIMGNATVKLEKDFQVTEYPKSHEEEKYIHSAVRDNVLFASLEHTVLHDLIRAMNPMHVEQGEIIIRQGDEGDYFYVVESGLVSVLLRCSNTYNIYFCPRIRIHPVRYSGE